MFTFCLKLCQIFLRHALFGFFVVVIFVHPALGMVFPRLDATKVDIHTVALSHTQFCLIFLGGYASFGFFVWDILKMVFRIHDATKIEVENLNSPSPLILDEDWLRKGFDQLSDRVEQLGDRVCRRLDAMEVEIQNLNSPSPLIQDEPSRWVRRRRGRRH